MILGALHLPFTSVVGGGAVCPKLIRVEKTNNFSLFWFRLENQKMQLTTRLGCLFP